MITFASDNVAGAAPEILEALTRANQGSAMPYGNDAITQRLEGRFREIFECDCTVLPVATGTAANVLSLSLLSPAFGAIYCHAGAHIHVDECGAPEFFTGGAKLVPLAGAGGKLEVAGLEAAIAGVGNVHSVQPAAISLTQASEAGTLYGLDEIAAIAELAKRHGLGLHMDGARFANALVGLDCSPAEATWKAGVQALSFGATKNGALGAEAVVVFEPELARDLPYLRKRGGHLFSKMRFLSAQLDAYLEGDLWLRNAAHANRLAARLSAGLCALPGASLSYPVEANEIFIRLPDAVADGLEAAGFGFYRWNPTLGELRMVTAFNSREEDVEALIATARRVAGLAAE